MFRTINAKLFIPMGMGIILIFSIFSYIILKHESKTKINEVLKDANLFSQLILKSTQFNMPINNRECVHRMMRLIGKRSDIRMVRMFDNLGKITFSTDVSEVHTLVDRKAESCNKCHAHNPPLKDLSFDMRSRMFRADGEKVLAFTTPIPNDPGCYTHSCHAHNPDQKILGTIDIQVSTADAHSEIRDTQLIFILFTVITILCLFVILIVIVHRFVTSPVKKMVGATRKIAQGDLDYNLSLPGKCELGQLAKSFNHMVIDLKKARYKIKSWNLDLEKKVQERTQSLDEARTKLIQAEKMASLGILAASVAHEINNPLQGILTYIKLMLRILMKGQLPSERTEEFNQYLGLMESEIERCGGMVKNLLVFSKQTKLNLEDANINRIIDNSLKIVENKIKLQNIKVKLDLDQKIPNIRCDLKQIQQTLIAFFINAVEAIQERGEIRIKTHDLDSKFIEITISDNGTGIEKDKLHNIFDPFFTTKNTARSTGLGLFVAYGIIKEHGGSIDVTSQPGEGTKFLIKLPKRKTVNQKDES